MNLNIKLVLTRRNDDQNLKASRLPKGWKYIESEIACCELYMEFLTTLTILKLITLDCGVWCVATLS